MAMMAAIRISKKIQNEIGWYQHFMDREVLVEEAFILEYTCNDLDGEEVAWIPPEKR